MKEKTVNALFAILLTITQVIAVLFYGVYFKHILPTDSKELNDGVTAGLRIYGFFQDIHVMIYVGFGFLLTSFHKFRLTSLVMCFWVAALSVQYYFLFNAFWMGVILNKWIDIRINTTKLIFGEVSAGAILIAVCAIVGKTSNLQYIFVSVAGIFLYTLNEIIVIDELKCKDIGGAMIIHTFGAFYGIGLTSVYRHEKAKGNKNLFETHDSLSMAMAGTLFLWCFWPSFNAALGTTDAEINIAVLNTYFSIIASVISAYATAVLIGNGKFNMGQILNATLAGGVAMGACADILYDGWIAYFVGSIVGIISTLCFKFIPGLLMKCNIHDVAGVLNLHGIPGFISGFLSAIFRAKYIDNKGGNQAAGTVISIAIGLFGGLIVGFCTKCFHSYEAENDFFNDKGVAQLEDHEVEHLEVFGHHSEAKHKHQQEQPIQTPGQPITTTLEGDYNLDRHVPDDETMRPKHHANNKIHASNLPPLESERQQLDATARR